MGYSIDLNRIPTLRYMEILKNQNLLPSRRILLENLEGNFQKIEDADIHNLAELKGALSSAQRLSAFAAKTGIPENYLIILKREVGSLEQKPVPISAFPDISDDTISILLNKKIKTSKDVYQLEINSDNIATISQETGIGTDELLELNDLCNLVRINGMGALAAKTIYKGGYKSVTEIARAKPLELLESMNTVNVNKQYYKAKLGEKDMQFVIDAANIILEAENT